MPSKRNRTAEPRGWLAGRAGGSQTRATPLSPGLPVTTRSRQGSIPVSADAPMRPAAGNRLRALPRGAGGRRTGRRRCRSAASVAAAAGVPSPAGAWKRYDRPAHVGSSTRSSDRRGTPRTTGARSSHATVPVVGRATHRCEGPSASGRRNRLEVFGDPTPGHLARARWSTEGQPDGSRFSTHPQSVRDSVARSRPCPCHGLLEAAGL
jgi:hypothetical protein